MTSDTTVSTIALAVALVALITTISQVLGQFLATADGYRRCQPSVMGRWAKLTHRRFRWSEMRFETMYTTPLFGLFPYMPGRPLSQKMDAQGRTTPHVQLDGSAYAMKVTYCEPSGYNSTTELASWVKLVEALHGNSRETLKLFGNTTSENEGKEVIKSTEKEVEQVVGPSSYLIPDIKIQKRSWDFVPPEVIRPLAMVTVSDIAVMARRLGMVWKQFEPLDGKFKAEGNGHTLISSTAIRSTGTVLQIELRDPLPEIYDADDINELYIPSEAADKMGFGIVPGQPALGVPDYKAGTEDEVLATLRNVVDPSHEAADRVKGILQANPGWTPGISDIIGFAAPMIRQPRSSLVRIPAPAGYVVGLTQQQEGFVVFRNRLNDLITKRDANGEPVTEQTRLIFEQYEDLRDRHGDQWEDQHVCNRILNKRSMEFLDDLHARHTAATNYFKNLTTHYRDTGGKSQIFRYTDLMYSHIRHAVNYFPNALERLNANPSRGRNHYGMRAAGWVTEGAHIYFDNIPKIISDMRDKGFDKPEIVEEAWLTMMFKAFLWHRCHFMVEAARVSSSNFGSRLPVYIG
ncbi:hypothetical protein MMC28_009267 [Mycoblastus sanguinarius]|nr:hypothetical protein [Mycoblastus sanguinarius]